MQCTTLSIGSPEEEKSRTESESWFFADNAKYDLGSSGEYTLGLEEVQF